MLVNEDDGNVLALCKAVKGGLDGGRLSLVVDNEEVPLLVGRSGDVLFPKERQSRVSSLVQRQRILAKKRVGTGRTPMPASSKPVTESYVVHRPSVVQVRSGYSVAVRSMKDCRIRTSSPITARNCRSL